MFKQAILITAYKNYNHLEEIITFFDENFEIYVHIDKKSKISNSELLNLKSYKIVKLVSQKYKVNWGGFNHLKSILFLSKEALKNEHNQYFHLISGHDYPIKSVSDFNVFFENFDKECIDFFDVPFKGWGKTGGLDRLVYYSFFDWFNWKIDFQKRIIKKIINFQKRIGFRRKIQNIMPKIYGGSTWWSLSRASLNYVVDFTKKNPLTFRRFRYTFCSEEFYFQTILMNSNFKIQIYKSNLRYIDWSNRNGNNPSVLDETDLSKIKNSDSFFARRFEYPISEKLIHELKKDLKVDVNFS